MKILVIGDAILDHYIYGTSNRMSPEDKTIPVYDAGHEEVRLGGCLNVAANIKSITAKENDVEVYLLSVFSEFTGEMLRQREIITDISCISEWHKEGRLSPSHAELIKTRLIDQKTQKQFVRIDNRLRYKSQDIEVFESTLASITDTFDAIVVSD